MINLLEILWDYLHWIVFGVGCLTVIILLYALFIAKWDKPQTEEEIMEERAKGEGM
jgi:hypothetical protein